MIGASGTSTEKGDVVFSQVHDYRATAFPSCAAYDELLEDSLATEDLLRLEREHRVVALPADKRSWDGWYVSDAMRQKLSAGEVGEVLGR